MAQMTLPIANPQSANKERLKAEAFQELHQPLAQPPAGPEEFQRSVEVVRVAIDLARLRGATNPGDYLAEAAKLITEARTAIDLEKTRPEQERAEATGALFYDMVQCDRISKHLIFQVGKLEGGDGGEIRRHTIISDGSSFHWTTFRSAKGFRKLLIKHYGNICAKAALEMRPMLCNGNPRTGDAKKYLQREQLFLDDETTRRLADVKDIRDGNAFLSFWQSRAVDKTVEAVFKRAKDGWLESATLKALAQTRTEGHIARAKKATSAKNAKVKSRRRSR